MKNFVLDYTISELENYIQQLGYKKFRARQIIDWVYDKFVASFDKMTNLPKDMRPRLAEVLEVSPLEVVGKVEGSDSVKFLLKSKRDGALVEAVHMRIEGKDSVWHTACVSVQVGCPVGCRFCETGLSGFERNLTAGEIVGQVWMMRHLGYEVDRIVFMGMGEPLINFDQVEKAVGIFTDRRMFGMSPRRITLSTVGIIPGLRRLLASSLKVHLAVSVHAPNDKLRRWLIPIQDAHPLVDVLDLAHRYAADRDVRLTAEYVLLRGVNDSPEHALELAKVLKGRVKRVNLIPYNPTTAGFEAPDPEVVLRFQGILKEKGYTVTIRRSVGRDVEAACGMLRRRKLDEENS